VKERVTHLHIIAMDLLKKNKVEMNQALPEQTEFAMTNARDMVAQRSNIPRGPREGPLRML
jgi:hypothetical protein